MSYGNSQGGTWQVHGVGHLQDCLLTTTNVAVMDLPSSQLCKMKIQYAAKQQTVCHRAIATVPCTDTISLRLH